MGNIYERAFFLRCLKNPDFVDPLTRAPFPSYINDEHIANLPVLHFYQQLMRNKFPLYAEMQGLCECIKKLENELLALEDCSEMSLTRQETMPRFFKN